MKVLQINSVCGIKSTGRICTDIASVVVENGDECIVAYGREGVPEQHRQYAHLIGNKVDVKLHALYSRFFDCAGFKSKKVTKNFIEWIKEYDPDIIHLHNIHGYYLNIEELFKYIKESNKPVVWTLHDCWSFTGHCCYFDFVGCYKWKDGSCDNCIRKKDYPTSIFLDNSQSNFKRKKALFTSPENITIVTPSNWLAERVKESYLSKYPVKVINNGIDTSVFKPTQNTFKERYNIGDKKVVLAVAAIWDKRKGLADVIELSKKLDEGYRVVIVGLSQEQLENIPPSIIGITKTNNAKELAEIYSAADVFVNTTYEDNYPTVNLEAQACGTPVVTYETGGSPEGVDENTGIVVKTGDIQALAEAVKKIKKPEHIPARSFDKNVKYKEYIELYKSLL